MSSTTNDFVIDETVLAYHGSCIYSAKIVRTQPQPTGESLFFVHYLGWNKKWDEWLPASRVLKDTETNRNFMKVRDILKVYNYLSTTLIFY